ncbi:MAG: hypothetical protein OFPII_28400 [Osedax symbiont Rs1]|nr:MAG: hypothetical protein OFPII_28400 [Osedax symbiont Rs1]
MIKVAIVGFGLSATVFHIPFVVHSPYFSLIAISTSRLEAVRNSFSGIEVYQQSEQMITESDADLIIITSPNYTHYPLAKLALESGKHVLIEKPMTESSEQALKLTELARQKSLVLSVYHNRRWDGDFLTLQQVIESGKLGDIRVFNSNIDRFRPVVEGRWLEQQGEASGVFYDLGSHLIDQVLHLFGAPQALTANCTILRENSSVTDYFQVMLHYDNMEVVLKSSPFSASPNLRFQLQGEQGNYLKYGLDPQEQQLRDGVALTAPAFGIEPPVNYGIKYLVGPDTEEQQAIKIETLAGCYSEYYAKLALAIKSNAKVPVSALEGARVIKVIELALQSSALGKRVNVDLSEFHSV